MIRAEQLGESPPAPPAYRWYVLALAALTNTITVAIPSMALSVLFAEISAELHLNLVQVGMVWGISSLPAIFTALAGGMIADRVGPKRVLAITCLLIGVSGALRGLAVDFVSLLIAMLIFGLFSPVITISGVKTCGMWFPSHQLGLANGVLSLGMALGFLMGSLLSATLLSPALGGWRHVLFLYGGLSTLLTLPWILTRSPTAAVSDLSQALGRFSLRQTLGHVLRLRNVWFLGLAVLGIGGCVQGLLGYLPLYLRGEGWNGARADSVLAAFHTISLFCAVPIALISDRLRSRKRVLAVAAGMIVTGVGLLTVLQGAVVWAAVCLAGMVRDGFMAVYMTAMVESKGVGPRYAGTAVGVGTMFSGIGSLAAPAMGNSLAGISPGLPFLFWAAMAAAGLVLLLFSQEQGATRPAASR